MITYSALGFLFLWGIITVNSMPPYETSEERSRIVLPKLSKEDFQNDEQAPIESQSDHSLSRANDGVNDMTENWLKSAEGATAIGPSSSEIWEDKSVSGSDLNQRNTGSQTSRQAADQMAYLQNGEQQQGGQIPQSYYSRSEETGSDRSQLNEDLGTKAGPRNQLPYDKALQTQFGLEQQQPQDSAGLQGQQSIYNKSLQNLFGQKRPTQYNQNQSNQVNVEQQSQYNQAQQNQVDAGQQSQYNQGQQNQLDAGQQSQYNQGQQNQLDAGQQSQYNKGQQNQLDAGQQSQYNQVQQNQLDAGQQSQYNQVQQNQLDAGQQSQYNQVQQNQLDAGQQSQYNQVQQNQLDARQQSQYNLGEQTQFDAGQQSPYNQGQQSQFEALQQPVYNQGQQNQFEALQQPVYNQGQQNQLVPELYRSDQREQAVDNEDSGPQQYDTIPQGENGNSPVSKDEELVNDSKQNQAESVQASGPSQSKQEYSNQYEMDKGELGNTENEDKEEEEEEEHANLEEEDEKNLDVLPTQAENDQDPEEEEEDKDDWYDDPNTYNEEGKSYVYGDDNSQEDTFEAEKNGDIIDNDDLDEAENTYQADKDVFEEDVVDSEMVRKDKQPTAPSSMVLFYTWMIVAVLIMVLTISTYQTRCKGLRSQASKVLGHTEDRKRLLDHEFT